VPDDASPSTRLLNSLGARHMWIPVARRSTTVATTRTQLRSETRKAIGPAGPTCTCARTVCTGRPLSRYADPLAGWFLAGRVRSAATRALHGPLGEPCAQPVRTSRPAPWASANVAWTGPLPQMTVCSAGDALAAQAERSAARVSQVRRK